MLQSCQWESSNAYTKHTKVVEETFYKILACDEVNNTANENSAPETFINDDGIDIPPPDYNEVQTAIDRSSGFR